MVWINIGTLIGHRQHNYGILLAKGMPKTQIYGMISFQMILATSIGMILAVGVFGLVQLSINAWFSTHVLEIHRDHLDIIGTLDLLPLTISVAAIHLSFLMPWRRNTAPSELLQS